MTLTIPLSAIEEQALLTKASELGLDPPEYVRSLIADATHSDAASGRVRRPAAALLAEWLAQDATDDPAALHDAEQDLAELKAALNANRGSERPLFP